MAPRGRDTREQRIKYVNQDLYQKAIAFAAHAHRDQKVPGTDYSYVVHLANVAAEVGLAMAKEDLGDASEGRSTSASSR